MNIYGNLTAQGSFDKSASAVLTAFSSSRNSYQEEETIEYSTIDGEVINSSAGTNALEKGKGILIGDYFVGISEAASAYSSNPFLRY